MPLRGLVGAFFALAASATASLPSAQQLAAELQQISLDPAHTYRVRDLSLARGDIKLYLTEGTLSFFTPVDHRTFAALFTTEDTDAGDAEVIVMPPRRSERASLASFAKTPNLDEHFTSALFFFTDNTASELTEKINRAPLHELPDAASVFAPRADPIARDIGRQIEIALLEALLDKHTPAHGLFYAVLGGRTLGAFDVTYDPTQAESVFVGRVGSSPDHHFELWTNFRPRRAPPFVQPPVRTHDYRLESTIRPDLSMNVAAEFAIQADGEDGRVLPLVLSPRLRVSEAEIDGAPVEIFQRAAQRLAEFGSAETLLLVAPADLSPGTHRVELQYSGSVIRRTETGEYFVDDRNTWYPVDGPVSANFDLTFHCPEALHLVSTGEPLSDSVAGGVRTVHRRTSHPSALAGFNLGDYKVKRERHNLYEIEIDAPRTDATALSEDPTLAEQTANILDVYTKRWEPLAARDLAVTPIAGYFGQGFPGLIYLSSISFIKERDRSAALRGPRFDAFFSELLLPHEIAHQWWGNIVRQADYRSAWISEAMANLSALDYIEQTRGASARNDILDSYREDLLREHNGKTVESAGSVDFGERLIDTYDLATWHIILYEKGSWIFQMLRRRLGDQNFREFQLALLRDFAVRPISNEELRQAAAAFVPAGEPDRDLTNFFDTWIYGTGIPALKLRMASPRTSNLEISGVADDFLAEIPLRCKGFGTFWLRAGAGVNTFDLPQGSSACELPSMHEFLYRSGDR
ncbi:MAG TPA: M1 family aminopeptidase [Bryobacteraceae bacterium]|nr:M1 family aminopeptidase [Bryobacteraceae bacterium]